MGPMPELDELQRDVADFAASLRAYLEQQAASGATGIPRGMMPARPAATSAGPLPTQVPAETPPAVRAATPIAPPTAKVTPLAAPAMALTPSSPEGRRARLPVLAREISVCTRCRLSETRTQTVFARGNPDASLCFIGEAPGAEEDARGLPFVGRAGQLLDRMIAAMGLSPADDAYILNIIRCRPPENRRPEPDEVSACLPYLHEQLDLVKPKVIVALGNTAVGTLLGTKLGISKLRGEWRLYRGATLVMPTYHPSYLLRPGAQQAEAKKQAWEDLRAVLRELKLPIPTPKKKGESPPDEEPS